MRKINKFIAKNCVYSFDCVEKKKLIINIGRLIGHLNLIITFVWLKNHDGQPYKKILLSSDTETSK